MWIHSDTSVRLSRARPSIVSRATRSSAMYADKLRMQRDEQIERSTPDSKADDASQMNTTDEMEQRGEENSLHAASNAGFGASERDTCSSDRWRKVSCLSATACSSLVCLYPSCSPNNERL